MNRYVQLFLVLLILVLVNTNGAMADTTYIYTGNPVGNCNGTYVVPCSLNQIAVSGYFTVSGQLAPNLSFGVVTPTSFSFSDGGGVFSVSSGQSLTNESFLISTDSFGNITAWGIQLEINTTGCANLNPNWECIGTYSNSGGSGDFTGYLFNQNTPSQSFGSGQNSGAPGVWTNSPAAVPEPTSLLLICTGTLGSFGLIRSKLQARWKR